MKPNCWWLAPVLLALGGASGAQADTRPGVAEGFPNYEERPLLEASTPLVQPARVDPPAVCAGAVVTLLPPPGGAFAPPDPGSRVLFAPCGLPGEVVEWKPTGIRVKVPGEAVSGAVWLATGVSDAVSAELDRGPACLRSLHEQEIVPERLLTTCDPAVGDPHDPHGTTLLRGIPPSKAFPDGVPPVRAGERGASEPPACRVVGPDRRGPLTLNAPKGSDIRMGGGPASCFETCEELHAPQVMLTVMHAPRVESFLPDASELLAPRRHRVERGPNRFSWRVTPGASGTVLTLAQGAAPATSIAPEDSTTVDVLEPIEFTLAGSNSCGDTALNFFAEPSTTLHISPERIEMAPGASSEVRIRIETPRTEDLPLAVDETSGGLLRLTPSMPVLRAGLTEMRVRVTLSPAAAALGNGAAVGQLTVRPADPTSDVGLSITDGRDLTRVSLSPGSTTVPPPAPGPSQVRVSGRLVYRDCISPSDIALGGITLDDMGCALVSGSPVVKPLRGVRVEVWDQAPVIDVQRAVVNTDENGNFSALVPADGTYDVTVVASSNAGQVNLSNDAITWFWKPLGLAQSGAGGSTLTYDHTFDKADSLHFNALDVITRGLEYALERNRVPTASADDVFRKAIVIPGPMTGIPFTVQIGNATHTWANPASAMWEDATLLHEYGHHLQQANGTYRAWASFHNGCYMTAVDGPACRGRQVAMGGTDTAPDRACWVNSPDFAWFEGFPTYYARSVADFDAGLVITPTLARRRFDVTAGSSCPLVTTAHFNHHNELITGAGVEDFVTDSLLRLRDRTDVIPTDSTGPTGPPLTRRQIEEAVFQIFFNELRGGTGMEPTVFGFRDRWLARLGSANMSWADLMTIFMMF